ncbi:hypothetical protein ABZ630_32355, partial [Streptomyces albidoflavus]|uniref:hypothetical protein n=1 Tax=Streptomyces albidoflavus TaxID=1886 RepID=UPI0033FA5B45
MAQARTPETTQEQRVHPADRRDLPRLVLLGACGCGSSCGCGCQSGGSCQCVLKLVPNELREASLALGVPKWRT